MKLRLCISLLLVFFLISCHSEASRQQSPVSVKWSLVCDFPDTLGRSASVSGLLDGKLVVGCGANFRSDFKTIYDDLYLFSDGKWHELKFKMPSPVAYAVSVCYKNGIFVVGGTHDGIHSSSNLFLISPDSVKRCASLPYALHDAAGALLNGDKLIIAGGLHDTLPSNRVFIYDIIKDSWSETSSYQGNGRVQPVAFCQNGAEKQYFYLFGGYNPCTKEIFQDGYRLYLKTGLWEKVSSSLVPLNGGTAVSSGVHSAIVSGGVNRERFSYGITTEDQEGYLSHEREWYRFNNRLQVYNTIVDRWYQMETDTMPLGLAGSGLLNDGKGLWLIMGEIKPKVRTSKIWYGEIVHENSFGFINWSVLTLYLLGMLFMGLFFMKRQSSTSQYFTGGGKLPWWAVSISIFATMLSAITFMTIPAKTYATDWRYFLMAITIFFVALPVIKYFLPFFRRLKITTAYEYLEARFNQTVRVMASLLFILFMTARMALVIYLPSLALTAATGIDIFLCIVLMSLITVAYSSMGGIEAVVWGDVVQGIILMGGAIFTLIYLISGTDGNAFQIAIDHDKFNILNWSLDFSQATFYVVVLGGAVNSFISYSSDQTVIQRYMTTSDEHKAAKSIFTNGILSVISSFVFYAIGTALFCYFVSHPSSLDFSMSSADSIFPFYIMTGLPIGVAGLLIAAIFAASMSTISSNINSISTAWTVDIRSKFHNVSQDDRAKLRSARITSVVVGLLGCGFALLMAIWNVLSLFDWFNMILGLLTGGLCAFFVMGIFIERIDGRDAFIGFLIGFISIILISLYTDLFFLMYGLVSIVISILAALLSSYLLPRYKYNKSLDGLTWKRRPEKQITK